MRCCVPFFLIVIISAIAMLSITTVSAQSTPITYMQDTTASYGTSAYSERPVKAEYISSTSSLAGKPIDTILVELRKSGSPSGIVQVGVFNSDLSAKQVFGTIDATKLATSYQNYTFSLNSFLPYQIQTGDRIGIKFTGGDSTNYVAIMTDQTNAFDGTNSYLTYYDTSWHSITDGDLWMTLQLAGLSTIPIIYMQDTTASQGLSVYSGRYIQAEYVSSTSSLVGKQIDTILVQLEKSGSPSGIVQVGVFNSDLSAKQVFGTIDASTLATSYKNYHFSLPKSDPLYQIQTGDRIGIKFTGGDSTNYVAIMTDADAADPFDGTNSYHTYYDTTWRTYTAKDLYMTLAASNYAVPVITLLGSNTVSTEIGLPYIDPSATALDFPDGDLTSSIVVSGLVKTGILGSYTVTYNVSDSQGNAATPASRMVMVVDTNPPAISITSPLINTIMTGPSSGVKINIKGTASDLGSGVVKVEVWNGASYQQVNPKSTGDWSSWNSTITVAQQGTFSITARATDVAGNQKSFTVPVTVQFSSSSTIDKFGVAKLYSSTSGGREWYANWSTPAHTIITGQFDPYDPQFQATGNGYVGVKGNGIAMMSGLTPRMYVFDPTLQQKWNNVEITFYGKRVSDIALVSWQGLISGARSGSHDDITYPNVCTDSTGYPNTAYNGRLLYDGRVDYEKEVLYHIGDATSYGSGTYPTIKPAFENLSTPISDRGYHSMPYNTWIGYKFVIQNTSNGVHMETWMDMTGGSNGGIWTKLNSFDDNSGWSVFKWFSGYSASNWPCPNVPLDYVINHPMPYVFVRADSVNEIDYKDFSVREINTLQ